MHAHDTNSQPPREGPRIFGRFTLLSRIAVGGCAEVFLARVRGGNATAPPIVVKRLLPGGRTAERLDILEREATLHRRIEHPNVVRVLDAGTAEDEPYIAMEYVEGLDLFRVLQRSSDAQQAIPPELAVYIVRRIADALDAVHTATDSTGTALEIVHGDVSPSNIYLSLAGEVKLGDFGIARHAPTSESNLEDSKPTGHFGYLAPEQLTGDSYDHRTDIFALGVILGELLIGERVFPGSGQLAVMLSIRDGNIAPLNNKASQLPRQVFEICRKALSRSPEDRYATAKEFAEALRGTEGSSSEKVRQSLSSWVRWAHDNDGFVAELEQRVRDSVGVMRAVSRSSSGIQSLRALEHGQDSLTTDPPSLPGEETSRVRKAGSPDILEVAFPKLIEMVATGELQLADEVALWGAPFQPVGRIEELARHLLPSTTAVTSRQFAPGPPDLIVDFSESGMLDLLGKLRTEKATASIFVVRSLRDREQRKDIYIQDGRLIHVASSDPQELFGEYLVGQGLITRKQLDGALSKLSRGSLQLGELLIKMKILQAVDIFTALRNQGRDRVGALCSWTVGQAQVYKNATPDRMLFPLDLDLSVCLMTGAMSAELSPPAGAMLVPGPEIPAPGSKSTPIPLLNLVPMAARKRTTVEVAVEELRSLSKKGSQQEANASILTAAALGWVAYAEPSPTQG